MKLWPYHIKILTQTVEMKNATGTAMIQRMALTMLFTHSP